MPSVGEVVPRPSLPIISYLLLPDIFLSITIAVGPTAFWRLLAFCLYSYVNIRGLRFTTGDGLQDYSMGSTFSGQMFTAIHLLWLTDPIRQFRHESDTTHPRTFSLLHRMYWAMSVNHSPRGIGWNYEIANVPPRPNETRWAFVRLRLRKAFTYFLLVDLAQSYLHSNALFLLRKDDALPITAQGYLLRCVNIVAWMCTPYGMINMQYALLGAFCVGAGISESKYWSNPFGRWSDAYTVRRFWGRTWHQMMRRYISSIGKFFCGLFGCKPGTQASSYSQLYLGFIVSGIMHSAGGDAMVGMDYLGASFPFFFSQALVVSFEDAVIGLARRAGFTHLNNWTKTLGFLWVFVWFSILAPWYINQLGILCRDRTFGNISDLSSSRGTSRYQKCFGDGSFSSYTASNFLLLRFLVCIYDIPTARECCQSPLCDPMTRKKST